jgi:hypothetical protein
MGERLPRRFVGDVAVNPRQDVGGRRELSRLRIRLQGGEPSDVNGVGEPEGGEVFGEGFALSVVHGANWVKISLLSLK